MITSIHNTQKKSSVVNGHADALIAAAIAAAVAVL